MLASVEEANTDLFTAHVLKEQLRAVFHPPAGVGARSVLAAWLAMVDEARLPAFDRVASKVRRALPENPRDPGPPHEQRPGRSQQHHRPGC